MRFEEKHLGFFQAGPGPNYRDYSKTTGPLRRSIETYGFIEPVLALESGEIVDGRARIQVAAELGLASVPCVLLEGQPDHVEALRLILNKIGQRSRWSIDDYEALLAEFPELKHYGFRAPTRQKDNTGAEYKFARGVVKRRNIYRCNNCFFMAFLQAVKKVDLKKLKCTEAFKAYVIEKMVDYINLTFRSSDDLCIVYAPKRRTTENNVAEQIASEVAAQTGLRLYRDAIVSHNRDRFRPDFELVTEPQESHVLLIDDVATSGATLINCVKLLEGKNVFALVGLYNQHN